MKVVEIIGALSAGGAEMLVKDLACKLVTYPEVEVEVWALSAGHDKEAKTFQEKMLMELNENGVNTIILEKRPHKDKFKTLREIRTLYSKRLPDIVNSHLEHVTFYVVSALMGKNVPIVQTIHNTVISFPFLQKYFVGKVLHKFVAISRRVEEILLRLGIPKSKIVCIHNGIDISKFIVPNRNPCREVKQILAIGRLARQKGYDVLLNAYNILRQKLLSKKRETPVLNIVGTGPLKNELSLLSKKLGISDTVHFLGVKTNVPYLLKVHDLYVMASRWEGFSISLLEAAASGIPIVATNVGSNSELIEHGVSGLLVPPENPEALAEAMEEVILNESLRFRLSKNAVQKAKGFSIETTARKYYNLYVHSVKACGKRR